MKAGVISANFKLSGNVPVPKKSLKSFCNILAVASELILGRNTVFADDFLGLMSLISSTTSLKATGSNKNLF